MKVFDSPFDQVSFKANNVFPRRNLCVKELKEDCIIHVLNAVRNKEQSPLE